MISKTDSGEQHAPILPVYQILAEDIRSLGIKTAFGLVSDDTISLVSAFESAGIEFCSTRHENNAVFAAEGYAAATRGLGVAVIGRGPALANGMHGIVTASRSGSKVLVISGDCEPPGTDPNGFGPDYKQFNAHGVMAAAGIRVFTATSGPAARIALADAVAASCLGSTTALLLPSSALNAQLPSDTMIAATPVRKREAAAGTKQAIDAAVAILEKSRKPLVIAGYGAFLSEARPAIENLATRLGALLATTLKGKDFFRGHEFDLGVVGTFSHSAARRLIDQADCVLAIGASLNFLTTTSGTALPAVPVIQVDAARLSIGRWHPAHVGVVGDARVVAEQLAEQLGPRDDTDKPFHADDIRRFLASFDQHDDYKPAHTHRTLDPRALALRLNELLPEGRNLIYDAGNFMMTAGYLDVVDPNHIKFSSDFASMGAGFGTALGFAKARSDEISVLIVGDGGFMMNISELDTVIRNDLPLVVVVMNDCAYGAELHIARYRNLGTTGAVFPDVDFALLAEPLGFEASTIRSLDDLYEIETSLRNPQGPILLDCKINAAVAAPFISEFGERESRRDT